MKLPGESPAIAFWILRSCALLVPSLHRGNWLAEWEGELTYVLRCDRSSPTFLFVLGSLQDAAWFRCEHVRTATAKQLRSPSWILCLGGLLGLLAFTYVGSRLQAGFTHAPFADRYDVRVDASLPNAALQIILALATLPAITSSHLGFYRAKSFTGGWWIFLLSKALMVTMVCHFMGLSVAHLAESVAILSNSSEVYRAIREGLTPVQFLTTFASCLYGMRWVLQDQRRRCPICLHCFISSPSAEPPARILIKA